MLSIFFGLWNILPSAFPEFGFIDKGGKWQASNRDHTKTLPGSPRPTRIIAYQNTPFGFQIQGGEFISWMQYLNNMEHPRGKGYIKIARKIFSLTGETFPELETTPAEIIQIEKAKSQTSSLGTFLDLYSKNALA